MQIKQFLQKWLRCVVETNKHNKIRTMNSNTWSNLFEKSNLENCFQFNI